VWTAAALGSHGAIWRYPVGNIGIGTVDPLTALPTTNSAPAAMRVRGDPVSAPRPAFNTTTPKVEATTA
jgi:hypothetical protein